MVEQRIASGMGLRVPAAKGATVKGMRPAEIILIFNISKRLRGVDGVTLPFECPMIAAVCRRRFRNWCRIICWDVLIL